MTQLEASEAGGEPPSSYIIFLVVFLFFLTGLLGFLICHLLKKKGYRCRTGDPEDEEDKLEEDANDENDENQDTVEQILKCIMENEANMEAFNEMLGNRSVCVRHDPRLRKESLGGVPPHLHTVHSGTDHNSCLLCAQVRAKKGRRQSRTPRFKQQPGEQTVFSVGRFRVTHSDKKFQGRPNLLAASGEQLDQSQDSDDIKEDGFNLKNMFKEVQPASDGVHGIAANVGKRKKSMTLFGLRRGSDPLGLRVKERSGADPRGVRFAVQRPPVVLEEPANPERGTKPGAKMNIAQGEVITSILKPSSKSDSVPQEGPNLGLNSDLQDKTNTGASAPTSLPIPTERSVNMDSKVDPGPLQTSTPIDTIPAPVPGSSSVMPTAMSNFKRDFMAVRASSDPCSSPDPEPTVGGGLALISLGSSPASSLQNKTFSSVSSLKTPTSSLIESPSPKSSLPNITVALAPLARCSSPTSASSGLISVRSTTQEGLLPGPFSINGQKVDRQTEEQTETQRAGILKTPKLSPLSPGGPASSSEQSFKDRLRDLPPSHSSPLSPSSPKGGRISSVTMIKATPDGKRQFSVTTTVDKDSVSSVYQEGEGSEKSPAVRRQEETLAAESETQSRGSRGPETRPYLSQDKDDMMEMEDIRDCKVTQVEGGQKPNEETMLDNRPKQNQEGT